MQIIDNMDFSIAFKNLHIPDMSAGKIAYICSGCQSFHRVVPANVGRGCIHIFLKPLIPIIYDTRKLHYSFLS